MKRGDTEKNSLPNNAKFIALLPAAGAGSRMGSICAGQSKILFRFSDGTAVLERSLECLAAAGVCTRVVLAIRPEDSGEVERLAGVFRDRLELTAVIGGASRQESVYAALSAAAGTAEYVLVHDAARPFCSVGHIQAVCRAAEEHGAAILALPVKPTLKEAAADGRILRTIPRAAVWEAQTPQVFRSDILLRAHEQARENSISGTDDSELVERSGGQVYVVRGDERNIKITSPFDLELAEQILSQRC
jgi:2-C-methyl-D-erythritol 4-phosphate cytidylyltransferase